MGARGEADVAKKFAAIVTSLIMLALGFLLASVFILAQSDRAQAHGGSLGEKECGNVNPRIRFLRTFGYNGHRAPRCKTGRKVARRWVALNCGRQGGDICQFRYVGQRWYCTVGAALRPPHKGKRFTGCNNQKTIGLSFIYR